MKRKKIALFYTAWTDSGEKFLQAASSYPIELTPIHYSQLVCRAENSSWEIYFNQQPLKNFHLFYLRSVGDSNELLPLLLDYAEENHIPLIDSYLKKLGGAFRKKKSIEAMMLVKNGIPYPRSFFVSDREKLKEIVQHQTKPLIIKSTSGRHGTNTFLVENNPQLEKILRGRSKTNFLVQEYIPNSGDYRLFLVNYQVIAGFKRQAKEKRLILSRSRGGSTPLRKIPPLIKQTAQKAAKILGIEIAGVDLVVDQRTQQPVVIEVNQAPEFEVMERKTGVNIAEKILAFLIQEAKK